MQNRFDVIVIGTGPGGGMAACKLAASGLRTLILEKETLPRHKPCGGGLPYLVKDIIDWDFSHMVENEIYGYQYLFDYSLPRTGTYSQPILMVDRSRFDQHFIERALSIGRSNVELREGVEVSHVQEEADGVRVWIGETEWVEAAYVIAADGVFSKTARSLGLKRKVPLAIAIDAEVEVDDEVYEQEKNRATFNFSCLNNGYGWVFPKSGYLSCGVGSWRGRGKLPQAMDSYLAQTLPAGSIRSVRRFGHPLPLYAGHRPVSTSRVCLVGDAASLVDPIMGEGIRFALKSGALAATVIGQLLGVTMPRDIQEEVGYVPTDCQVYTELVKNEIGSEFEGLYRFIAPLFFSKPEFFYRKFFLEGQNYFQLAQQLTNQLAKAKQI
jgi:geranylgeranyl reductase family protein